MRSPKTHNGGTITEAAFWSMLRSMLRRGFRYWKPYSMAKLAARRPSESDNKRLKWEFQCKHCKMWFPAKEVQTDHVIPCGSLRCWDDLVPFVKRLTAEGVDSYQILCKPCHNVKTQIERKEKQIEDTRCRY